MTGVLIKGGHLDAETCKQEVRHVKILKAELYKPGVTEVINKPPEARGEAWDRLSLSASEGTSPTLTLILDFWPPDRERVDLCGLSSPSVVLCCGRPKKLNTACLLLVDLIVI